MPYYGRPGAAAEAHVHSRQSIHLHLSAPQHLHLPRPTAPMLDTHPMTFALIFRFRNASAGLLTQNHRMASTWRCPRRLCTRWQSSELLLAMLRACSAFLTVLSVHSAADTMF